MRKVSLLLGVLFICSISASVNAAVINYEESVSGDLPQVSCPPSCVFPTSVGTLGIGTNTVSGSLFQSQGADFLVDGHDFDVVSFIVPAGSTLEGITFAFSATSTTNLTGAGLPYGLLEDVFIGMSFQVVDIVGGLSPVTMFDAVLPLATGDYFIQHSGSSLFCTPVPCRWDIDYIWSLVVSGQQVPEPATLVLFGLGLAGLGFARRRKQRPNAINS